MEDQNAMVETTLKFTWTINNFSKLINSEKRYSQTFFTGPHPWRIVLFPEYDNIVIKEEDENESGLEHKEEECECLSIYLAALDYSANLPHDWFQFQYSIFNLSVINQFDCKMTKTMTDYDFNVNLNKSNATIGSSLFMDMDKFINSENGFLVNDKCIIVAEISLDYNNASFGSELVNFKGLCEIEKDYVELLVQACSKHPSLIESHRKRKRSQRFYECSFTTLGKLLHFLKTKKVKDMKSDDACKELQDLWDEAEIRFDDLSWLEPHVKSALSYFKNATKVEKLKGNVVDLEEKVKSLKAEVIAIDAVLETSKKELAMAEKDFVERDLDDQLGCGIP